jgi:uncharacterized iron-regulated protein
MKAINQFVLGIAILFPILLFSDIKPDILPLGPSRFRYELAKIEKGQIMDTRSGALVTIADMVRAADSTDVFVIGEHHDSGECHRFQREFIEALCQKFPRLVVGFEFFFRDDDAVLEQWRSNGISEEELIEKTGWYKKTALNYGYTRMVMEVIKKYGIKAIGLNVPREIIHRVSRSGFKSLSPDEKKLFPTVNIPNPEHRFFIKTIFGAFSLQVPAWFNGVYQAQTCWDSVMAESMRQDLDRKEFRGYKAVIIAGSYHVAYKLGIPFRYGKSDRSARLATIIPVSLSAEGQGDEEEPNPMKEMLAKNLPPVAVFSRGIGDYVFSDNPAGESFYPVLGITASQSGEQIEISRIDKEGIAAGYGLKKGDLILTVDGIKIESLEQFRLLVSRKEWGENIRLGVEKKIEFHKESERDPAAGK